MLLFHLALLHRKSPTRCWAQSIGISFASRCPLCKSDSEIGIHLFIRFPFAAELWAWLLSVYNKPMPYHFSAGALRNAFPLGLDEQGRKLATAIFFHIISLVWYARNEITFNSNFISPSRLKLRALDRILEGLYISVGAILLILRRPSPLFFLFCK